MDYKNKSIPVENVTSYDVNKSIQRSLTKACARHGLGLYIYADEDLPEEHENATKKPKADSSAEKIDRKAVNLTINTLMGEFAKLRGKSIGEVENALMRQISAPEGMSLETISDSLAERAKTQIAVWLKAAKEQS